MLGTIVITKHDLGIPAPVKAGYDDLVLITIDCLRYDALSAMDSLQAITANYQRQDAISQAPATRGAFPALLAGLYYPQAYDAYEEVKDDVRSLPEVLADHGYTTGAVIGSNPFLSVWRDHFDYFWNNGLKFDEGDDGRFELFSKLQMVFDYARLRSRVKATEVAEHARTWYRDTDPPRFLWVHLMDIHVPYLPGFRRGLREGLIDVYRSHYRFMKNPKSVSDADHKTLERLYWRSVDYLDEQIKSVFGVPNNAEIVVTGDHGEEFDHGQCGHVRLWDECVRVPLLTSPDLTDVFGGKPTIRHFDVPAALLASQGIPVPEAWEVGSAPPSDPWPVFILNHSPTFGRVYTSVRTQTYKLIKVFDEDRPLKRPLSVKGYDLAADPGETVDKYGEDKVFERLEMRLDRFLEREDIRGSVLERPDARPAVVDDRLQALGYK